jgi:predicted nucleotidyltransferase
LLAGFVRSVESRTTISDLIREQQEDIAAICRRFGVRKLEVFGSAARGDFDP